MPTYFPVVSTRSINRLAHTPGVNTFSIPAFGFPSGTQEHDYTGGYLLANLDPSYLANSGNITTSEVLLSVNAAWPSLGNNHPDGDTSKGSSLSSRLFQIHLALANVSFTYDGNSYTKAYNTIGLPNQSALDLITSGHYMGYGSLAGGFQRTSAGLGTQAYSATEHVQTRGTNQNTDFSGWGTNTYQQQRTFQMKNNNTNPISMGVTEYSNTN